MSDQHTSRSGAAAPQTPAPSGDDSANRDKWELPGLVSALRGRKEADDELLEAMIPEADDGLEFEPHALTLESWALSLPAVDGLVPPPDEGRPNKWLGEELPPSVLGERADVPQAFDPADDARLPQLRVPLSSLQIDPSDSYAVKS